jgi:NodT family efflux transporter outer membrane factor (OMF) lipoprotein
VPLARTRGKARLRPIAALAILALSLAGCTLGPDFVKPSSWFPSSWFESKSQAINDSNPAPISQPVTDPIAVDWWSVFNDAELVSLENRVATANLDVKSATVRLAESRAQRRITAASEFPQVNGDASYQRERPSEKGVFNLLSGGAGGGGSSAGGMTGFPAGGIGGLKAFDLYQYGLDASWELDLWGRVRRSIEAADASIDASAEARRSILISVLAEVALDYIQLRGVQTQLQISRENLATAQDSLALTQKRAADGLTSQLDVANAAAQVATTRAAIPQLQQQEAQVINQLGFLLGEPPGALADELATAQPIPPVPPRVPLGLPSELARRRPDIRQAEAQLHAQTAQIGVAVASFYPSVTLNGSLDLQAIRFADLGSWAARTYSLGPSISIPLFEGGRLKGNLALTKAEQQEAAIGYQRTVLNAWQEVDNALIAYRAEQRRRDDAARAVAENRRALDLAREQYRQGLIPFLQVLTDEQQLLAAEQQDAQSTTTVSTNLVSLYKALGGGWETTFPDSTKEAQQ